MREATRMMNPIAKNKNATLNFPKEMRSQRQAVLGFWSLKAKASGLRQKRQLAALDIAADSAFPGCEKSSLGLLFVENRTVGHRRLAESDSATQMLYWTAK